MSRFEAFRYALMVVLLGCIGVFGWKLYRVIDLDRLRLALESQDGGGSIVTGSTNRHD